jgi:hypothetical protein
MRRVGLLITLTLLIWSAAAYLANRLWGSAAVLQSLAAVVLCLVPAAFTLYWSLRARDRTAEARLFAMLGGMGMRMAVVLGLGCVLYALVPVLHSDSFWVWLILFYLVTLALEVGLLLVGSTVGDLANVMKES